MFHKQMKNLSEFFSNKYFFDLVKKQQKQIHSKKQQNRFSFAKPKKLIILIQHSGRKDNTLDK